MDKIKKIADLIVQLLGLVFLLSYITHGGMANILGAGVIELVKVIVQFGISAIALSGAVVGLYLPTRRHRIFRDTQIHSLKYIGILSGYQLLCMFLTGTIGGLSGELIKEMPGGLTNILIISFVLIAIMMPFNYIKSLFTLVKSVEYRDPRSLIKQLFR
jgi:hypothetical protein